MKPLILGWPVVTKVTPPITPLKNMTSEPELHTNHFEGEFTRLLVQYWHSLGRPSLQDFVSRLPMETAFEKISAASMDDSVASDSREN